MGVGNNSPTYHLDVKGEGTPAPSTTDNVLGRFEQTLAARGAGIQIKGFRNSSGFVTSFMDLMNYGNPNNDYIVARVAAERGTDGTELGSLLFYTNAGGTNSSGLTERMRITSAGVVRIANLGTGGSKYVKADVSGNLSATATVPWADVTGAPAFITSYTETDPTWTGTANATGNIERTGSVGIGTSPAYKLDVSGDINHTGQIIRSGVGILYGSSTDSYANIRVIQNTSTAAVAQDGMYINYGSTGGASADLRLFANGTTERVRIQASTGNVGIGTTAPGATLNVIHPTSNTTPTKPTGNWASIIENNQDGTDSRHGLAVATRWGSNTSKIFEAASYWSGSAQTYTPVLSVVGDKKVGVRYDTPQSVLNVAGGLGIGTGVGINTTHGERNSIQINTDTDYGGLHNEHSGYLIYSTMPGGWGTSELHFGGSNNWGSYETTTPDFTIYQDGLRSEGREVHSTADFSNKFGASGTFGSGLQTIHTSGNIAVKTGERYTITILADMRNTGGSGEDAWRFTLTRNDAGGCGGGGDIANRQITPAPESDHNGWHTYTHTWVWIATCDGTMSMTIKAERFDSDDNWQHGDLKMIISRF